MVDLDNDGRVRAIEIKPARTHLRYAWIIAVWTPTFTRFMHGYLAGLQAGQGAPDEVSQGMVHGELSIGNAIRAAIDNGMRVEAVPFPENSYLDIGTPSDLVRASLIWTNSPPQFT